MAAIVPKSDRKKLVSTQLVNHTLVWHNAATEAEMSRLDLDALNPEMKFACLHYGAKQIVADVVAALDPAERLNGMKKAVASLGAGAWPRRESQATVVTLDLALDVTLKALQVGNPAATLADVRRMLGLDKT